ncbi:MAG TPA: family 43 glycosylhydrolase [Verrucomicrobiae bacterium]
MRLGFLIVALLLWEVSAVAAGTYCNPLDLDYKYNFEEKWRNISYRSGADPVLLHHHGEYFLFSTIADGYWHSPDLRTWRHVKPQGWPEKDMVAPAAISAKGRIFILPSTYERRPIYTLTDPAGASPKLELFNDELPYLPGALGPWDPAFFYDEDKDEWYLYVGSSNLFPIYGIELDWSKKLTYKRTSLEMIVLRPELHGWERFGSDHRDPIKPFMEGAWVTKHAGKYYLQYGAPGTEHNVYANGAYTAEKPLGPWTYQAHNPVSYKPGGFVNGAGHGNTFQDKHGNYWNTGTPWIAVNYDFERRIAMFPAGFDQDGIMYANNRFGDFPQRVPTSKWQRSDDLFAGWMLLSYKKPAQATSTSYPYSAVNVTDENPRTFWLAETNRAGEKLTLDLGKSCEVRALQVNFTDWKSGLFASGPEVYTQFLLNYSDDAQTWKTCVDLRHEKRDRPNAYVELASPIRARYIQYEHLYVASPNLAISDLRVFGTAAGERAATPAKLTVRRDTDPRNAHLTWEDVPGATGYNILWGIAPDKLYNCYQVWADQRPRLEIRALTLNQKYSFAIESFNESSVSKLSDVVNVD